MMKLKQIKLKHRYLIWLAAAAILLVLLWIPFVVIAVVIALLVVVAALVLLPNVRRWCLSTPLYQLLQKSVPPISATEREVIESGTTWWEKTLFQGSPDWQALLNIPPPALSREEQDFLTNETEELCRLVDDWQVQQDADLSAEVWEFIKTRRFFAMIIPKFYGGLGFSAAAHSAVITKLASRSSVLAVTVMVPNSLGPAELLLKYGSDEQKSRYLPRLARGEEIPCFALTSLQAGSDASGIEDFGVVCEGEYEGQQCLGLRITWRKRYITLAPVASLIGLAIKVFDPEQRLDKERFHGKKELGITCVLVPAHLPGVERGRRHSPLDTFFQNGPTTGDEVFVPLDCVIGGEEMIGQGWRMLVECLVIGRSLSIPALSVSAQQTALYTSNAYTRVREQFRLPIAKFEGIQKKLAQLAIDASVTDAMRTLTLSGIDSGNKPAVVSAIVKYYSTENARHAVNIAMDIHGGKAIMQGPKNYLASIYKSLPILITVEGANILTRSLMIFGQGALRCHPYLYRELECLSNSDTNAVADFDKVLSEHAAYHFKAAAKAVYAALSKARFSTFPAQTSWAQRHYQDINYVSALFAYLSDLIVLALGGEFKKKEILSGYFADALAMMYAASALLKQHHDHDEAEAERDLVALACTDCLSRAETALYKICLNLARPVSWWARLLLFPLGRRIKDNSDSAHRHIARQLYQCGDLSERLSHAIYLGTFEHLDQAVSLSQTTTTLRTKLKEHPRPLTQSQQSWLAALQQQGVLSANECAQFKRWQDAVNQVIEVDSFEQL